MTLITSAASNAPPSAHSHKPVLMAGGVCRGPVVGADGFASYATVVELCSGLCPPGFWCAEASVEPRLTPCAAGRWGARAGRQDAITYNDPPHRFEAGTPAIIEAVGLGAALVLAGAQRDGAALLLRALERALGVAQGV